MRIGILAAVAALSACSQSTDYTLGERGRAELQLETAGQRGVADECFIDCAIDRALLLGTTERIVVANPDGMPWLHGASSDESVLIVEDHMMTCCAPDEFSNYGCTAGDSYEACLAAGGRAHYAFEVDVHAVGEGGAQLVLASDDDPVFDRLPLEVRAAASLEIDVQLPDSEVGWAYRPVTELDLAGEHRDLRVVAHDRDGNALFASGGVTMSLRGEVAAFDGKDATLDSAYGEIWPMARGVDALTAQSGTAVIAVPVVSK